jgi:hypothetical protein
MAANVPLVFSEALNVSRNDHWLLLCESVHWLCVCCWKSFLHFQYHSYVAPTTLHPTVENIITFVFPSASMDYMTMARDW